MTQPKPHGIRAHRLAAARQADLDFAPIARGCILLTEWEGRLAREARRIAHTTGADRNDPAVIAAAVAGLAERGVVFPPEVTAWRRANGVPVEGVGFTPVSSP